MFFGRVLVVLRSTQGDEKRLLLLLQQLLMKPRPGAGPFSAPFDIPSTRHIPPYRKISVRVQRHFIKISSSNNTGVLNPLSHVQHTCYWLHPFPPNGFELNALDGTH